MRRGGGGGLKALVVMASPFLPVHALLPLPLLLPLRLLDSPRTHQFFGRLALPHALVDSHVVLDSPGSRGKAERRHRSRQRPLVRR